jgi:uroporphyrinogen-III synthase
MSILVTRPLPASEELVSRLRAWDMWPGVFRSLSLRPAANCLRWAASWPPGAQAICCLRYPSMR